MNGEYIIKDVNLKELFTRNSMSWEVCRDKKSSPRATSGNIFASKDLDRLRKSCEKDKGLMAGGHRKMGS